MCKFRANGETLLEQRHDTGRENTTSRARSPPFQSSVGSQDPAKEPEVWRVPPAASQPCWERLPRTEEEVLPTSHHVGKAAAVTKPRTALETTVMEK